jgi:hypothetical protein
LKLKRLCGGAGKLKCKFELLVQVRKVEALMQFLGFEDWVQFASLASRIPVIDTGSGFAPRL